MHTARWTHRLRGTLTGPQYSVLCALAEREPSDQATAGDTVSLHKSSMAEVVDRLASRGLVTVLVDTADRRRKTLRLSGAAREALPGMTAAAEVQKELMGLLVASARRPFLDALAAVAHQEVGLSA